MEPAPHGPVSGALVIDKPVGESSSRIVTRMKWALIHARIASKSIKIGHGGTLDPFASGVLVVLIGEATKLSDCYLHSRKTYTGRIRLGVQTDSGDPTGTEIARAEIPPLTREQWQTLADRFVQEPYFQTPPMHSAKKREGVALYELARKGISVEREPLLKKIERLEIEPDPSASAPFELLSFETICESGTYVRVLAEDLARSAGTLAHLATLRRVRSSDRHLGEALPPDAVEQKLKEGILLQDLPAFVPLQALASHVPSLSVSPAAADAFRTGLTGPISAALKTADAAALSGRYCLLRKEGAPVALLERPGPAFPFRLQRVLAAGLF
jgi:tRNA pseudouridine55 synthase